jgi:hypothetical protein
MSCCCLHKHKSRAESQCNKICNNECGFSVENENDNPALLCLHILYILLCTPIVYVIYFVPIFISFTLFIPLCLFIFCIYYIGKILPTVLFSRRIGINIKILLIVSVFLLPPLCIVISVPLCIVYGFGVTFIPVIIPWKPKRSILFGGIYESFMLLKNNILDAKEWVSEQSYNLEKYAHNRNIISRNVDKLICKYANVRIIERKFIDVPLLIIIAYIAIFLLSLVCNFILSIPYALIRVLYYTCYYCGRGYQKWGCLCEVHDRKMNHEYAAWPCVCFISIIVLPFNLIIAPLYTLYYSTLAFVSAFTHYDPRLTNYSGLCTCITNSLNVLRSVEIEVLSWKCEDQYKNCCMFDDHEPGLDEIKCEC